MKFKKEMRSFHKIKLNALVGLDKGKQVKDCYKINYLKQLSYSEGEKKWLKKPKRIYQQVAVNVLLFGTTLKNWGQDTVRETLQVWFQEDSKQHKSEASSNKKFLDTMHRTEITWVYFFNYLLTLAQFAPVLTTSLKIFIQSPGPTWWKDKTLSLSSTCAPSQNITKCNTCTFIISPHYFQSLWQVLFMIIISSPNWPIIQLWISVILMRTKPGSESFSLHLLPFLRFKDLLFTCTCVCPSVCMYTTDLQVTMEARRGQITWNWSDKWLLATM